MADIVFNDHPILTSLFAKLDKHVFCLYRILGPCVFVCLFSVGRIFIFAVFIYL